MASQKPSIVFDSAGNKLELRSWEQVVIRWRDGSTEIYADYMGNGEWTYRTPIRDAAYPDLMFALSAAMVILLDRVRHRDDLYEAQARIARITLKALIDAEEK
ncbi:MAG: hypothetical protein ACRCSL_16630 [Microbacterium sp.]